MLQSISRSGSGVLMLAFVMTFSTAVLGNDFSGVDGVANPSKGPSGLFSLDDLTDITGAAVLADSHEEGENPWAQGWSFRGYIQAAYTWNFDEPRNDRNTSFDSTLPSTDPNSSRTRSTFDGGNPENSGRFFDTEHNDILLHSAAFQISKEATDESWVGMAVTFMGGHDAKFMHSVGLNTGDDVDFTDAYISIRVPSDVAFFGGGELKLGKFQSIVGVERIAAVDNAMHSRAYTFGFALPIAHVGALYSQDLLTHENGDTLVGIQAGVVNSTAGRAGRAEDDNDSKGFLGQIRVAPTDFMNLAVSTLIGNEPGTGTNSDTRAVLDIASNINMPDGVPDVLKPLSFTLNYVFGGQESGATNPAGAAAGSAKWYGFSGIAKYEVNPNFYVAFRGEAYRDSEGFTLGLRDGLTSTGEFAKDFFDLTFTIGYRPWENFLLRAEYRYDKADQDVFINGGSDTQNHMNTVSVDAIVTF